MRHKKSTSSFLKLCKSLLLAVLLASCSTTADTPARIIYLNWDENNTAQIFLTNLADNSTQQLTNSAADVMEYAVSPAQNQIAFVTREENGGETVLVMDWNGRISSTPRQLLTCPDAACNHLVWHPDEQRLIYEKRPFTTPNLPTLWWVDVQTGDTVTVLSDPTEISSGAAVSPDGIWLSYVSLPSESMQFVNFASGERFGIPSNMGTPAVWHPDSQQAIIRDLDLTVYHGDEGEGHSEHEHDFSESVHLFSTTLTTQTRQLLDETGNVDDSNAAYSPDGEWITFGRKVARTNTGRQLWLMRQDGSEAKALTDDLMLQHGPPSWSENGRFLLHQQANLTDPNPQPAIWQYDLETSEMSQLLPSGWFPNWLR